VFLVELKNNVMTSAIIEEIRGLQRASAREIKGVQVLSEDGRPLACGTLRILEDSKESIYVNVVFSPESADALCGVALHAGWVLYKGVKIPLSERDGRCIPGAELTHLELNLQCLQG
jgi:hypothetical protein